MEVTFPDPANTMHMVLSVRPGRGSLWEGACVQFSLDFSPIDYPIKAPVVKCITRVYHPNISLEGAVCLSMLKEVHRNTDGVEDGWKPVNTLTTVVLGVYALFLEPNPNDPLNIREFRGNPHFLCVCVCARIAFAPASICFLHASTTTAPLSHQMRPKRCAKTPRVSRQMWRKRCAGKPFSCPLATRQKWEAWTSRGS